MKAKILLWGIFGIIAVQSMARTYYVTPAGTAGATGNSYAAAIDIKTAVTSATAGDLVLLQAGTYKIANSGAKNGFTLSKTGKEAAPIRIEGDGGQAIINFQWGVNSYLKDDHGLSLTGSYYMFKNIMITQAGYNGAYVTGGHNTFDNCVFYNNRNTGLEINKGGSYTTVINCDAYYNYDLRRGGGMADGFGPKQTMGPGNTFTGCRAWENSDDGFDLFDSPEKVIIKNCWTFRNGKNVYTGVTQWGTKDGTAIDGVFKGNGNGFKLGGNGVAGDHEVYNCVSFENVVKGFDQNNNTGSVKIYNSTGYNNGTYNFAFGGTLNSGEKLDFRNNLSYSSPSGADVKNATQNNNSWNLGISVGTADFVNLTTSLATVARNADGSLPYTGFLVPTISSKVFDKGVNVGLPYCGAAPELGAFEVGCNKAPVISITAPANDTTFNSPANFTISVAASDADGTVTYVKIYNGTRLVVNANLYNGVYSIDRTIVNAGTYTFTAVVTDNDGATTTSDPVTIIVGMPTQTINLAKGLNLVSINLRPSDSSITSLFSGADVQEIKNLNGFWRKGQSAAFNSLTALTPGMGYVVNMNAAASIVVSGTAINAAMPAIPTTANWTLVGCPYQTATDIGTAFDVSKISAVKNFESFWDGTTTGTLTTINPGNGYFVKLK